MPKPDLSQMTKDELLRFAEKKKIPVQKSMLKGEILSALKKATKKAQKLAEEKKAKTVGKKVSAKKAKKSAKPKTATAPARKKSASKKSAPVQKVKPIVAKDKAHEAPLHTVPEKNRRKSTARKKPVVRSASSLKNQAARGYDPKSLQPKFELEDMAQEAKFIIGKPNMRDEAQAEISPELPLGYGDNKIVMLVRDPWWCYLYWELQEDHIEDGLKRLSRARSEVRHVLRVHKAAGGETFFDVDVDFRHLSHYLKLSPGVSYYTEIGLLDREGYFAALAVSNTVTLPLDGPSDIIDEKWITTDENFAEIYYLSGGDATGKTTGDFAQNGSAKLQKVARENLNISSSGVGRFSSAQIQLPEPEKGFSYWLDMELIVYGGADTGSVIELSGNKLDLRPDGTFTARFSLPEGELKLPVTFISPDGANAHTVTPNINRRTESKTGGTNQ